MMVMDVENLSFTLEDWSRLQPDMRSRVRSMAEQAFRDIDSMGRGNGYKYPEIRCRLEPNCTRNLGHFSSCHFSLAGEDWWKKYDRWVARRDRAQEIVKLLAELDEDLACAADIFTADALERDDAEMERDDAKDTRDPSADMQDPDEDTQEADYTEDNVIECSEEQFGDALVECPTRTPVRYWQPSPTNTVAGSAAGVNGTTAGNAGNATAAGNTKLTPLLPAITTPPAHVTPPPPPITDGPEDITFKWSPHDLDPWELPLRGASMRDVVLFAVEQALWATGVEFKRFKEIRERIVHATLKKFW